MVEATNRHRRQWIQNKLMSELLMHIDIGLLILVAALSVITVKWLDDQPLACAALSLTAVQSVSVAFTRYIIVDIGKSDPHLASLVFYFGYAFLDLAVVVSVYVLHNKKSIPLNWLSYTLVAGFSLLGTFQIVRFYDVNLRVGMLNDVYSATILGINVIVCMALTLYVALTWWARNRRSLNTDF
jgi:hypothetical protein